MANKKKKRNGKRNTVNENKKGTKKLPIKKLGIVIALFALSTALYYAFASAGYGIVYPIYVALDGILFVAYFVMNKGLMSNPGRERLDDSMTEEEKDAFLCEIASNRKRSAPLLYLFLALLLTIFCDTLYAQVVSGPIGELLSKLTGGK